MSLGATISAPAAAWLTAVLGQQFDGSVVQHVVMISFFGDEATMSVGGVFAEANICDHDQIWCRLF